MHVCTCSAPAESYMRRLADKLAKQFLHGASIDTVALCMVLETEVRASGLPPYWCNRFVSPWICLSKWFALCNGGSPTSSPQAALLKKALYEMPEHAGSTPRLLLEGYQPCVCAYVFGLCCLFVQCPAPIEMRCASVKCREKHL